MTTPIKIPQAITGSRIRTLPDRVVNQIAAGEVVERPASVIKELVENGIDAGATQITVSFRNGGKSLIEVIDNGCGMNRDDALLAFERHATSKIAEADDLKSVKTLGFRGEALASIASVCRLTLSTTTAGNEAGVSVMIEGGVIKDVKASPPLVGASIEIKDLFYNTPVRRKFLRSEKVEAEHAAESVYRQAIANPAIRFKLIRDGKTILDTRTLNDEGAFLERIKDIFGAEITTALIPINFAHAGMSISGFISRPSVHRSSADMHYIFLNGRYIKDRQVGFAIYEGYRSLLPKGRKPALFLNISAPTDRVDVNVHPTKIEVRFVDGRAVVALVKGGIYNALIAAKEREPDEGFAKTGFSAKPDAIHRAPDPGAYLYPPQADPWRSYPAPSLSRPAFNEPVAGGAATAQGGAAATAQGGAATTQGGAATAQGGAAIADGATGEAPLLHYDAAIPKTYKVLGQIFGAFLLIEDGDRLLLIDQHTAHERVLYERFMNKYKDGGAEIQELLFPVEIELSLRETDVMTRFIPQFERLGFLIEPFGGQTFTLRSTPSILKDKNHQAIIRDTLDRLTRFGDTAATEELVMSAVNVMACRGAVKANDKLGKEEIEGLIEQLRQCKLPYTCPHGRPIALAIERDDLLKGFLRK